MDAGPPVDADPDPDTATGAVRPGTYRRAATRGVRRDTSQEDRPAQPTAALAPARYFQAPPRPARHDADLVTRQLVREPFRAMGSSCAIAVTAAARDERPARHAIMAARWEVVTCEQAFSRFDPRSDLSRVNANAGEWVMVDRRLVDLVATALQARSATGGRFDPTILPALIAVGYDGPFDTLTTRLPRDPVGWGPGGHFEFDNERCCVRVGRAVALDLGAIAKGWSADRALKAMRAAWPSMPGGLVDLGGDLALWGSTPDGSPWRVAVTDPRSHSQTLTTLTVAGGGVATSGRDRRRFGPGRILHHLIDPASGSPALTGPLAATVVADAAHVAEIHATVLAMCDTVAAVDYVHEHPGIGALLVPLNGPVVSLGALGEVELTSPTETAAPKDRSAARLSSWWAVRSGSG